MSDLSQDELTVLMIADKGESMMAIGRWEAPVNSLVARGYLKQHDKFNNSITDAGRQAVNQDEDDDIRAMITVNNAIANGRQKTREAAEAIAVQLVDLAEASSRITGDSKRDALEKWSRQILTRALEIMR